MTLTNEVVGKRINHFHGGWQNNSTHREWVHTCRYIYSWWFEHRQLQVNSHTHVGKCTLTHSKQNNMV